MAEVKGRSMRKSPIMADEVSSLRLAVTLARPAQGKSKAYELVFSPAC